MEIIVLFIGLLVIGWRAMRAHEKLAEQATRANDRLAKLDLESLSDPREALRSKGRDYREFVKLHPDVEDLTSKERHERFREWEIEQD